MPKIRKCACIRMSKIADWGYSESGEYLTLFEFRFLSFLIVLYKAWLFFNLQIIDDVQAVYDV